MLAPGLALFFLAFGNLVYLFLEAFRFRSLKTYYDYGELGRDATNFWKFGNQVYLYSSIIIWDIVAITALLDMFIDDQNIALVGFGVVYLVRPFIAFIYGILTFFSYNNAYTTIRDFSDSNKQVEAVAAY